jgi:Protein of unknown function (DUF1569)
MAAEKLHFIKNTLFEKLSSLQADAKGNWGLMNGQQMVEHLAFIFGASAGKVKTKLLIPDEFLPRAIAFLWSDKEFRENTKAPEGLVPETPPALQHSSMQQAIAALQTEVDYFIHYFTSNPGIKVLHPSFGELDYEGWLQLHQKHVTHHLKQFGLL